MKSKIVEINSFNFGSTGNVMLGISEIAKCENYDIVICCPRSRSNQKKFIHNQIFIGSRPLRNMHIKLGYFTGFQECFSFLSTVNYLRKIRKYGAKIIHIHNLHGCYINLPLLFRYIKKNNIKVIWTLHDCWAFTGHCPHFTLKNCNKWQTGCHDCPQYETYPASQVDRTKTMWRLKKKWFTGVQNMTIVTPSKWLAGLVKRSYLKEYPVKVIHNGIDLNVFKPLQGELRNKYKLKNKFIVLGVAFNWDKRKGLDIFIELSKRLSENYQIILVGTDKEVDKVLPDKIISIHRTGNQTELAEIYTAADVFVNPTREENYPTVNMEAIACGTPVITFNTGGSPESVTEKTGVIVKSNQVDEILIAIERLRFHGNLRKEDCLEAAKAFDRNALFQEYIRLFEEKSHE